MIQTILVIAGSDPSGGAGIQADLKTITSIGALATAVITCITVQNSFGVTTIEPLPQGLVKSQILAVLEDHNVTHIKIGMVGTEEIAEEIANALELFHGEVIYDPVMRSTTGQQLFTNLEKIKLSRPNNLLNRITVLTPNFPELELLTNIEISSKESILKATSILLEEFPTMQAVLLKGGHGKNQKNIIDYFIFKDKKEIKIEASKHVRIRTNNSHGTGCSLASAFTAFHSLDHNMIKAFSKSIKYLSHLMEVSANKNITRNPAGKGPLLHYLWDKKQMK